MTGERTRDAVLEQEFLPLRAKILEIAAGLDRLDRAVPAGDDGGRRERLEKAIQLLLAEDPSRAARVQLLFSRDYDEQWRSRLEV
ncbi:hypothetical protein [Lacipirellula parvula]|uniref:Uncharacterized protein n=1 Tax=Lacipirellula parvula TaxID=2650471 RepID=A0A5K7XKP5_9BACT|nr:hypothetical protein [Lacipirellula parvula]BBO33529.1 hypothetical protein PLANPX_3141 [Lacipirellula parvula]